MKTTIKFFLLLSLVGGLLFLSSCTKKTENITNVTEIAPLPYVIGEIAKYDLRLLDSIYTEAWVEVYGFPSIPYVAINNDTIPRYRDIHPYPSSYDYYDGEYYELGFPLAEETIYNLVVSSSSGQANASVKFPGEFYIKSPDEVETWLPPGEFLNVEWKKSVGCEWYGLFFYWDVHYHDEDGNGYYTSIDTLIILDSLDVDYRFTASFLWPQPSADYDVIYAYGTLYTMAATGPKIISGGQGNVTGKGAGFFLASYYGDVLFFDYWFAAQYKKPEAKPNFEQMREKLRERMLKLLK